MDTGFPRKPNTKSFLATQNLAQVREGRNIGPTPAKMKPSDSWLNRLAVSEEELPRGKYFDLFRRKNRNKQSHLINERLSETGTIQSDR